MKVLLSSLLILAAIQISCNQAPSLGDLPSTYSGTVPCPDCDGITITLTLRVDSLYLMRQAFVDDDTVTVTTVDLGVWQRDSEHRLALSGQNEDDRLLAVVDAQTLRLLDRQGQIIESGEKYDLTRTARVDFIRDTFPLRGRFTYLADANLFQECATDHKWPIAMRDDYLTLERAYLDAQSRSAETLLVTFHGHIDSGLGAEGRTMQEMIVVDEFINVWPESTCDDPWPSPPFSETYWKLVQLRGQPVLTPPDASEAHLRFTTNDSIAVGSTGCNNLNAAVERTDTSLSFSRMAVTRKTCPATQALEDTFISALETVDRYRITADTLLLYNNDNELMRFVARYF